MTWMIGVGVMVGAGVAGVGWKGAVAIGCEAAVGLAADEGDAVCVPVSGVMTPPQPLRNTNRAAQIVLATLFLFNLDLL
jgi:hypothetical protein